MFDFFKKRRRAALLAEPFPEAWRAIVAKNVVFVATLGAEEKTKLEDLVRIFLGEKTFEGCGGLTIDDEIKVTIAAQACVLLLHRDADVYPDVDSVLVYPSTFVAKTTRSAGAGVVIEADEARLGEAWTRGTVVLAWDAVKAGTRNAKDGKNVVLHEFAHQLDAEDGSMDGAPDLEDGARYTEWAQVLGSEYEDLLAKLHAGRRSDIDSYGATNPAEFFAVLTEMFFEKPRQMKQRHPDLYDELATFYAQDPAKTA